MVLYLSHYSIRILISKMFLSKEQMKKDTTKLILLVQDNGVEHRIKIQSILVDQLNPSFYQQYLEMNTIYHLNLNQSKQMVIHTLEPVITSQLIVQLLVQVHQQQDILRFYRLQNSQGLTKHHTTLRSSVNHLVHLVVY